MRTTPILNSFVAGVISNKAAGRTDIQQYSQGAEDLLNCIVECYGGAKNRPGFYWISEIKDSTKKGRGMTFNFNDIQAYSLLFGDYTLRFERNHAQIVMTTASNWVPVHSYVVGDYVISGSTIYYCIVAHSSTSGSFAADLAAGKWVAQTIYEIPSPYAETEIKDVIMSQTADIAYLFHPDHPIYKLSRTGHTAWTLVAVDFSVGTLRPALMEENVSTTTITPSAATGNITLTASTAIFQSTHIGSIWKVNTGYVKITGYTSGTVVVGTVLYGGTLTGTSAYTVWSEAAWSGYRGYPRCGTFNEQRCMCAATKYQPQTVWGSKVLEYENYELGADDADGLSYTIATDQVETIKWLFPADQMALGASGGVHSLGSGSSVSPLTPTNVLVRKQTTYGVRGTEAGTQGPAIPPVGIGSYAYYWQKYGRKLREYIYNYTTDKFEAYDATVLAEHITKSGVVAMAYQQEPDNNLWCVLSDGKMAIYTRQIEQKVQAWTPADTDGYVESAWVVPGEETDELHLIVRRLINGTYKRYHEYMVPRDFEDQEDCFFVDCGISLDNPITITNITAANPPVVTAAAHGFSNGDIVRIRGVEGMEDVNQVKFKVANKYTNTFELNDLDNDPVDGSAYDAYVSGGTVRECYNAVSGLSHLEGRLVSILVDGGVHAAQTVTSGSITLQGYYSEIHVGLKYQSRVLTLDLEGGGVQGTSQGKTKRVSKATVRFLDSLGCKVGTETKTDPVIFRSSEGTTDVAPALYTGDRAIPFPSGWAKSKKILITQDDPLPMHVLCIIPVMETND